ncbi:hypothetical protein RF55_9447 [Lasius niger]|uniref:Retrotransposon gag domain-containing protein n=1 Tax=Lasius niger TaxID=67767 RepID=A0A0J7KKK2_LASNI|nr:hypothetical protein RF55_9447 [Lasius niger]
MFRHQLEGMSLKELQAEARRCGIMPLLKTIKSCIESIMAYVEDGQHQRASGSREEDVYDDAVSRETQDTQVVSNPSLSTIQEKHSVPSNIQHVSSGSQPCGFQPGTSTNDNAISQLCALVTEQMRHQQIMLQQILTSMENNRNNSNVMNSCVSDALGGTSNAQSTDLNSPPRSAFSSVPTGQAVKLLASQLPVFGGTEDEDVEIWLQKVESVAGIHAVADEVTLLAAISKLNKSARRWFDLTTGSVNHSWSCFKEAITKRFKRRVLFHVAMQKVEAHCWNFNKETFQEYALDKLTIMQSLKLPDRDSIHLLIDGISSNALRGTAAVLQVDSVDEFLEQMHHITTSFSSRKANVGVKQLDKSKIPGVSSEKESSQKIDKDLFCVYCRAKGHVQADCLNSRKRNSPAHPHPFLQKHLLFLLSANHLNLLLHLRFLRLMVLILRHTLLQ